MYKANRQFPRNPWRCFLFGTNLLSRPMKQQRPEGKKLLARYERRFPGWAWKRKEFLLLLQTKNLCQVLHCFSVCLPVACFWLRMFSFFSVHSLAFDSSRMALWNHCHDEHGTCYGSSHQKDCGCCCNNGTFTCGTKDCQLLSIVWIARSRRLGIDIRLASR